MSNERMTELHTVQQQGKSVWGNLKIIADLIIRLAALMRLTEAEQEEAGIHIEHQGGE